MKHIKILTSIIVVATFLFGIHWWRARHQSVMTQTVDGAPIPLVVGTNVGYPPFIVRDESGAIIGFDNDVALAIAERLGRPLVYKDMAFDALLLALMQGSVDIIIGGISLTHARQEKGWFVQYYGDDVATMPVFYHVDRMPGSLTLQDIVDKGFTVCTQAGTSFEELLQAIPGIRLKTLADISDIFLEVSQRHSDVGILDAAVVASLVNGRSWLSSHDVEIPEAYRVAGFGIGVTPRNNRLFEQISQVVQSMKEDGSLQRMAEKWL